MNKWKTTTTGTLIELNNLIIGDGYRAKNSELSTHGIPFARAGNINDGFHFENADYFPETDLLKVGNKISQVGDVVFTSKGTVGRLAYVRSNTQQFVYSPQLCFWRSTNTEEVFPRFIFYWMQGYEFWSQTHSLKDQTDMADYVSLSDQRQMKITLPPLSEQKAIASVLESFDDKIDMLTRQNRTLESIAETLFRQWFIEEAKDDWEEGTLGDFIDTTSGGTPSRKVAHYFINGTHKWVKSKELNGSFIFDTEEKITDEGLNNSSAKLVRKHTILIALYGATVGEYGILAEPATCNQAICAIIPNENYPYTFLFSFIKNNKDYITTLSSGSAQQNISQVVLRNLGIISPNPLIIKFHKTVEPLFEKMKWNSRSISYLEKFRDTLLPKLMSGEVRVKKNVRMC